MRRALICAAALGWWLAMGVGRADAGTYEVLSCGAAGGVNHAWQAFNQDTTTLVNGDSCASLAGGPTDGLFAVDRIPGPPNSPKGRTAGWRLTAPAGTRITRLTAQYYLGQNSDGEWFPYIRTSSGQVLETCQPPGGDPECERGAGDYHPFGPVWTYELNTGGLEAGVSCAASIGACGNGATLHHAWLAMYSTRVRISDSVPPALTSPAPALSGSYLRGTRTLTLAASDSTGIRATALYVDAMPHSPLSRACDFTRVAPCSNEPGALHTLDTGRITDGVHSLREVAEDAAGNQVSRTSQITVDKTPPATPQKVSVKRSKGAPPRSPELRLSWTNPAGQVAPITAAHWLACRREKPRRCRSGHRRGSVSGERESTGLLKPPLPDGRWDARLWLEDAAGNVDAARAAAVRLTVKRRSPRLRIVRVARRGDLVTARGTTAARRGNVRVRVERRIRGRTSHVGGRAMIRRGSWSKRLRLSGALADVRQATLAVRFPQQHGYGGRTARRTVRWSRIR